MNCEYKRDLNNNYMILNGESGSSNGDYRVRMLVSNKIPFFLKCNIRKVDGIGKYYYEITSKHPLTRVFDKKKIGIRELQTIATDFQKVLDYSMEYLLDPNDFILKPEYIYMDIETNQAYFCYLPGYGVEISKSFHELSAYLLDKINHEDKYAVATAYELYRQTLNDNYSIQEILTSIQQERIKEEEEKKDQGIVDSEETFDKNTSKGIANQAETINKKLTSDKKRANDKKQLSDTWTLVDKKISSDKKMPVESKVPSEKKILSEKNLLRGKILSEDKDVTDNKTKNIYIVGIFVIGVALALLSYFLYMNKEVLKNIQLDSDVIMKIVGIGIIIIAIGGYSAYKYVLTQREKEEDIFVINEGLVTESKKKVDEIPKEVRQYKKEPQMRERKRNQSTLDIHYTNTETKVENPSEMKSHLESQIESAADTYGNTVLLAYKSPNKKLISSKEYDQSFTIGAKSFLVGKMEEHVDGIIRDNMASRIHAEIKCENGTYFLTDLNSTNGTFHNGRRLEANETVKIVEEDILRFATAEYVFR